MTFDPSAIRKAHTDALAINEAIAEMQEFDAYESARRAEKRSKKGKK